MLELILIRHGETDSNKKGKYLGWTDIVLNEEGIRQANFAKDKLMDTRIDEIHSSPLMRARKTAEIINENHGIDIIFSDCLKERNFGIWDDFTFDRITSEYPEEYEKWTKDWINYRIEKGESSTDTYRRVTKYIDGIISGKEDMTIAVVTHLGCIRIIIAHLLGLGIEGSWRFRINNCGINKITINDEGYAYLDLLNG